MPTIDAIGKPQYNFWVNLYAMSVNFIMIYFGLKRFGYMGAAYGEILSIPLIYSVIFIVLKRTIQVDLRNIARNVFSFYKDLFSNGKKLFTEKKV